MPTPRRVVLATLLLVCIYLTSGSSTPKGFVMHDIRSTTVAGSDGSGELFWLATNPVRWWITDRNGNQVVVVGTPCGGFQAVVEVTDEQVILDQSKMRISAISCEPPLSEYDRWVHKFMELPLNYSWDEKMLTISNERGSLTMSPKGSST